MIEVGHPFSRPFQGLVDSLVTSLQLGVEQPATQELLFRTGTFAYPLRDAGAVSGLAEQITGFVAKKPAIFTRGVHYVYAVGQLVWQPKPDPADPEIAASWFPDDNSRLTVGYFFRDLPSGVTDFNEGSVAGTLVRAMARELKLIYEQMDQAYRRAFIDYAEGFALDNVVALLGISRNLALPAQGEVTFWLKKPSRSDVPIAAGTRVADPRGRLFKVTAPGIIRSTLEEPVSTSGTVLHVSAPIGALVHVRATGTTTDLKTVPTKAGKPFGDDDRTVTLAAAPPSTTLTVSYQPKKPQVTVPVVALEAGPEGNLGSGTLTVMPTPPRGVDGGVTNDKPLTGGEAAEADEQLRERAKHELERAGNATLNAIHYSVLNVDGVDSVQVLDQSVDQTIPLGEVRVRVSTGKPEIMKEVVDVVEKTRAAGIKARVTQVTSITLSGRFYVIPDTAGSSKDAFARYKRAVVSALGSLGIGEPVSARKLASLVFGIAGLADVAEAQLDYVRGSDPSAPVDKDPFVLKADEQARPDEGRIDVVPVRTLTASAASLATDGTLAVTVQARDEANLPIRFRNLQLAVRATVRAKPRTAPNQPLQQVAEAVGTATFTNSDSAVPAFPKVPVPGLADLDAASIEVVVEAAAYPGIGRGSLHLTLK
jgi:uncharacterized phage protein gp47/JayE